jgi:branched-chain amino acid transport system permease protein
LANVLEIAHERLKRPALSSFPAAPLAGLPVACVAVLLAVPFVAALGGQAWVRIANFAILYIFLALGLNIVVGYAGLLDLGYVAFYAVGAYTYALLASPHFGIHLPFWVILPLGAGLACIFGVLLGAPTLKLRGDYLAIVTLGFGEIVRIFMNNLNAPINVTNGAQGITLIDPIRIGDFSFAQTSTILGVSFSGPQKYYFPAGRAGASGDRRQYPLAGFAHRSCLAGDSRGRGGCQGLRDQHPEHQVAGFAMGASFGGIAGGVFSAMQGFVSPESFSLMESITILAMVVLGGMGHIPGVILGAVLLTGLPEALRYGIEPLQRALFGRMIIDPESLRMLVFGLALVLVMRFRPAGLWPSSQRRRELAESAD